MSPSGDLNPSDDLMTALIDAEVDGERLTDAEIVSAFSALSIAGIDTTRNTLTFGLRALTEFEEQRKVLMEDLPGRIDAAVIEMVRYASPVGAFVRRATEDTELGGVRIARDDRVALFYMSANRDEDVFTDPGSSTSAGTIQAGRLGWRWAALLPGREPRQSGTARPVHRTADPDPHDQGRGRAVLRLVADREQHRTSTLRMGLTR